MPPVSSTRSSASSRRHPVGSSPHLIASSAAIVVVGFLAFAFAFAECQMFRTIGPGLALAVTVALLAGLRLVPALMAAVSPRVLFWPARLTPVPEAEPGDAWARLGRVVARAPADVLAADLVVLLVPALRTPDEELSTVLGAGRMPTGGGA